MTSVQPVETPTRYKPGEIATHLICPYCWPPPPAPPAQAVCGKKINKLVPESVDAPDCPMCPMVYEDSDGRCPVCGRWFALP